MNTIVETTETSRRPHPGSRQGSLYPLHSIVAHIDDGYRGAAAEAALRQAGWSRDEVLLQSGEEVTREADDFEKGRSLLQRIGAAFPSEETEIEKEFKDSAARGVWMLFAKAETDEARMTACAILRRHGGYGMRHYGARVITTL